ncbi:pyruvate kinase [Microaerobacter geothermalis]|uniref:pyruvate kinase n=1 Tax=Microaerobacter geothermalis TaxID=674972 RepID=UPI001F00A20C|nr:pyruvate kinase [Microaerobacter geothermalis]MCF6092947.1 pyruvate kinase [Microaerobacter geothermalis]
MIRKTKIICTIGPASEEIETLKRLIESGMNVARLNFSHGDYEEHGRRIENIREAARQLGANVAILLDTKGPEIRIGKLLEEPIQLHAGDQITLTTEELLGTKEKISITYSGLPGDVHKDSTILLDDGLIELKVISVTNKEILCRVVNGGELKSRKGVNVPGAQIKLPGITKKDADDIKFGISRGIDFIAASFVRKASDILEIREILENEQADFIKIIAKIENREGVNHVDEILEVADGIMVARGDLGVEIPAEEVPLVQKQLIKKCNNKGKVVITATQMLDSMQRNPRPTRAEASDVANAIFDGSDAIMLSGETAAGKYPVEAVDTMVKIALKTEEALTYREILTNQSLAQQKNITDAISQAVANAALDLEASAIITSTESGHTARMISKYRPKAPIIAITPNPKVMRHLALVWGVVPLQGIPAETTDEMLDIAINTSIDSGLIKRGDLVIITAGVPVREPGTTNLMKVHIVGDIAAKGQGIGHKVVTGKVVVGLNSEDILQRFKKGDILVTLGTDKDMMPAIEKASAIITEEGGLTSHAAIVGLNMGIPVVVGVEGATKTFHDGMEVTVDSERGHIYRGHAKVL